MSRGPVVTHATDEAALTALAGRIAARWRDARGGGALAVGLRGPLGAGKTTWVRGMLRGLGHTGRVPSPTYTLLEEYDVGALTVVHLDLYRLGDEAELEALGIRDWLERPGIWTLAEWPERSRRYVAQLDLMLEIGLPGGMARQLAFSAGTDRGRERLDAIYDLLSS